MTDNRKATEPHGCIVCGRSYQVLAVYRPGGEYLDGTILSPSGGHMVAGQGRPIVACDRHSQKEIDAALGGHFPGGETDEDREARD